MEVAGSADPHEESEAQRDDRNLAELLQELRVAGLGVQVLFGFLLSLPFTNRFSKVGPGQRDLYLASLVLAALGLAVSAAVLLVTSYVAGWWAGALITAFIAGTFGILWFAFPLTRRR